MSNYATFIQELSGHLGQHLSASDETQTHTLRIGGEDLFLRCTPEEEAWIYFGFVTDFMRAVTPEQMEKALELNLCGRGTAGFHLGLIGQALALSGSFPLADTDAEHLAEQLVQLADQLAPLHRDLTSTEAEAPHPDEEPDAPATPEPDSPAADDTFSFLNTSFLRI